MLLAPHWWLICHIQYKHSVSRVIMNINYACQYLPSRNNVAHDGSRCGIRKYCLSCCWGNPKYWKSIQFWYVTAKVVLVRLLVAWHLWKFHLLRFSIPKFRISVFCCQLRPLSQPIYQNWVFPLWMYIQNCKYWNLLIFLHIFTKVLQINPYTDISNTIIETVL